MRGDDDDPPGTQIYGLQPFRYGRGFIALVEVHLEAMERKEVQLAWSRDGLNWKRVGGRRPILPPGGEGSWESHGVSPTLNPPLAGPERMMIHYLGANGKHGGGAGTQSMGLSTLRRDGWVSLEAGRPEGVLVTRELPLTKPMKLELNVHCLGGHVAAEVLSTMPGREFEAVPGYGADASRAEMIDDVRHRARWGDRSVVQPLEGGRCHLRLFLRQGSLFSFRWSRA